MAISTSSIQRIAALLTCSVCTFQASAQDAAAFATNHNETTITLSPLMEGTPDHLPYLTTVSGYIYAASTRLTLDPGQPLPETMTEESRWVELHTTDTTQGVLLRPPGLHPAFKTSAHLLSSHTYALDEDLPNRASFTAQASVIEYILAPRTSATFTNVAQHTLDVGLHSGIRDQGFANPDDPTLPGTRAAAYSYFGPVKADVLAIQGKNRSLFEPYVGSNICPACEEDKAYWQQSTLEPNVFMPVYSDGLTELLYQDKQWIITQQYTVTNDTDLEKSFHLQRFSSVTAMNVVPTSAVPEAHSAAMLGFGLLAVTWIGRRKCQASQHRRSC